MPQMMPQPSLMALSSILTLGSYKHRKDLIRESVLSKYQILGYIAAGTYGKVYKAKCKAGKANQKNNLNNSKVEEALNNVTPSVDGGAADSKPEMHEENMLFAIKKFKTDNHLSSKGNNDINGNEVVHYTGISQSAIREMSLCRELNNSNIIKVIDIILENKSIYMVFEYCEHDLLQIIQYHSHPEVKLIPDAMIKSLIWQVLNGVTYLHKNWIFHRDLKPANIMVSSNGVVKVGDLGLSRKFNNLLQSLYTGDKVVVTIWYRAPELLLGARHYTPAIDLWAVGCILAELLSLRPIFKGEEAKIDMNNKKLVPFQRNQLQKIIEILGSPDTKTWPSITKYPEYPLYQQYFGNVFPQNLSNWYKLVGRSNRQCFNLLKSLLEYDPLTRITADSALEHHYFKENPVFSLNAFEGSTAKYPKRRIYTDDSSIVSNANAKRHGTEDGSNRKRLR